MVYIYPDPSEDLRVDLSSQWETITMERQELVQPTGANQWTVQGLLKWEREYTKVLTEGRAMNSSAGSCWQD